MTLDEIKELIQVVQESGVAELEVQRGENRVRIRRSIAPAPQEIVFTSAGAPLVAAAPQSPAHPAPPATSAHALPAESDDDGNLEYVKSPIVGTFYEAPSAGAPPFVKVGDTVSSGQVLCIIESMKLMNEIETEVAGIVDAQAG